MPYLYIYIYIYEYPNKYSMERDKTIETNQPPQLWAGTELWKIVFVRRIMFACTTSMKKQYYVLYSSEYG